MKYLKNVTLNVLLIPRVIPKGCILIYPALTRSENEIAECQRSKNVNEKSGKFSDIRHFWSQLSELLQTWIARCLSGDDTQGIYYMYGDDARV